MSKSRPGKNNNRETSFSAYKNIAKEAETPQQPTYEGLLRVTQPPRGSELLSTFPAPHEKPAEQKETTQTALTKIFKEVPYAQGVARKTDLDAGRLEKIEAVAADLMQQTRECQAELDQKAGTQNTTDFEPPSYS